MSDQSVKSGIIAPAKPSAKILIALGLSQSYVSELLNEKKRPSLETALLIQEHTGYPVTAWKRVS